MIDVRQKILNLMMIWGMHKLAFQKKVTKPMNYGSGSILVVATGPSSNRFWESERYRTNWREKSYDFCLINDSFFKYKDIVFRLKPKFYCIMDSYYFDRKCTTPDQNERFRSSKENRKLLNSVDWELTLIVPSSVSLEWLDNPMIKIIRLNSVAYNRDDLRCRFSFYKKNWMNPGRNNVVQAALYFAITFGYKQIALLGGEFSFWRNVYLNKDRHVIQEIEHCYKADKVERIYDMDEDYGGHREGTMSTYLACLSQTYAIYSYIREYADMMGAHIVNYSDGTMIESFEIADDLRITDGKKESDE